VGQIIRICSAVALILAPEIAAARGNDPSALAVYGRARIAPTVEAAARNYSAALTAAPDTLTVALRAYREGVTAGDFALALRAAQALERGGATPPDARLLFYVAALRNRDWAAARTRLGEVAREPSLSFIAPVLADWLALVVSDPLVTPLAKNVSARDAYARESRALVQLASGQIDTAITTIRTLWTLDPYRAQSLRIAAASTLVDARNYVVARALVVADEAPSIAARARIDAKRRLGVSVDSPARGTAFVLARMAGDLITENGSSAAISLARFAQFADPKNARIALTVANALAATKRNAAALALVGTLTGDALYGSDAQSLRIDLLEKMGRTDEALREATARAGSSANDLARLGDIEMRRGNYQLAATRYTAALTAAGTDGQSWNLWHAAGNAHLLTGDWVAAKAALERALALAPDEPTVLNSLGFGLVDRGETLDRASAMLQKADRLRPDDPAIIDSLGWAAYRRRDFKTAITRLERAVALDQAQPEIGEHLGDAYWSVGRLIEARYAWAAARVQADGVAIERLDGKIARGLP